MGLRVLLLLLALAGPLAAEERGGRFDYYLLALSWDPGWCAVAGEAPACRDGGARGFRLHGLWPQHEAGWPEFCATEARDPGRGETAAMAELMGSAGLAWYQWQKHGRCSGLDPAEFFALARDAVEALDLAPPAPGRTTPAAVEAAFRARNPGFPDAAVTVICREGLVVELRLCLTRALAPRACGADVAARACRPDRPVELPAPG